MYAQGSSGKSDISSENGWYLSPHGTICVLMLFVEIEYDLSPELDPRPRGDDGWPAGMLPSYANDVFDAVHLQQPLATMTRYYDVISMGNLRVLGDYWHEVITLKESEIGALNLTNVKRAVINKLPAKEAFRTGRGLPMEAFDNWRNNTGIGRPRINEPDEPMSLDHVMMFLRNFHLLRPGNGSASGSSFGPIFGLRTDTHSQFASRQEVPQTILRHEFNHLLIGGNNFHCCGGSGAVYTNHFIPTIYGWGMMGNANTCMAICNAWDRHRLGWRGPGKEHLVSALNQDGLSEVETDLDATNLHHAGRYLLRDFATSGDALRIKIPFIPESEYQQYLWLENHRTYRENGIEFDRFVFEHYDGMTKASPGIYMMMQVDRDRKEGPGIFGGYADYLRPVLADGYHDYLFTRDSSVSVVGRIPTRIHIKSDLFANPLTGSNDMQAISYNKEGDSVLAFNDILDPLVELGRGGNHVQMPKYGHSRHAFRVDGNNKVAIGRNPSAASMMTYVSGRNLPRRDDPRNNRIVRLNGISVELVEERGDGSILVEVQFNQTAVDRNTRWCADTLELHVNPFNDTDLEILRGVKLHIDHGETATRRINPVERRGQLVFVSPTTFILKKGTLTRMTRKSRLIVDRGSRLVVESGASLELDRGARIIVRKGAELVVEPGATVQARRRQLRARSGGTIKQ